MATRTWHDTLHMRPVSMSYIARELPTVCARHCDPPPLVSRDRADVLLSLRILAMDVCSIPKGGCSLDEQEG
jgi:hypothetical protein